MSLWKSFGGMVEVELTSADIGNALAAINGNNIRIFGLTAHGELTIRFQIQRKDYRKLKQLTARRGESLQIASRRGIYWDAKRLLRRPVLVLGICLLLVTVLFMPSRVYFVEVEGNASVPTKLILESARDSGIRFGASRRAVRSEKMKNKLLSALPQLQWAGVNTYGCVAVISVRERSIPEETENSGGVCSIVAARDGIILSCTATRGNMLCTPWQAVQKGDILISGYTDCGLTITADRAEGEILAETKRNLTAVTPSRYQIRGEIRSRNTKYSLIIGKKRINFYKGSGIWDASCGKMYTEYHLTLPGGFRLPVTLVKETETSFETAYTEQEQVSAEDRLNRFAESYLRQSMVAGAVINRDCTVYAENGVYRLTGEFSCTEMIGLVQWEKIGAYNGKTN